MNEKNKDLLILLLEKILKVKIRKLEYLNLEQNVDNVLVKRKHFDLFLKTDFGKVQVEINTEKEGYVNVRNMAYLCDIYSHTILQGEEYSEDVEIIQINFSYHLHDKKLIRKYYYQDEEKKKYVRNMKTYEINMDKYMNYWYTKDKEKIEENKEIIMLDLELEELEELSGNNRMVKKYMEEIKRVNSNPEFREYMSAEEDNRKIENTRLHEAEERGYTEGIEEGLSQGLSQGLEQGISQGLEQGLSQGLEQGLSKGRIESARNMLNDGLDISVIAKYVGLEKETIEKLKEEVYGRDKEGK